MSRTKTVATLVGLFFAALGFAQENVVVLGKLGQSVKTAAIFATSSTRSRVYFRVKPYQYLIIQPTKSASWFRVMMQDGRFGFVQSGAVAKLPYEVTCDATGRARAGSELASRKQPARSAASGGSSAGDYIANASQSYLGAPYKWGGNNPGTGIDCSAFVKMLYGQIGINLPRTAEQQASVGQPIRRLEDLQAGDRLYFWSSGRNKIGHTGVYLGNGFFTHSSSGNGGVTTSYLGDAKWRNILVDARR